jgi:hypothetical protein
VYGGFKCHAHNAISYTWGRFKGRAADALHPSVTPQPVRGITWAEHRPRINAAHFTLDELTDQLEHAILRQFLISSQLVEHGPVCPPPTRAGKSTPRYHSRHQRTSFGDTSPITLPGMSIKLR